MTFFMGSVACKRLSPPLWLIQQPSYVFLKGGEKRSGSGNESVRCTNEKTPWYLYHNVACMAIPNERAGWADNVLNMDAGRELDSFAAPIWLAR